MTITLRQLSYLVALAEEKSFSRAADRVRVSQPALSMQMRDLEATLGVTLVDRLPREVRLTPAGRDVLQRALRVIAEVGQIEAIGRKPGQSGRVNIGVIPTVAPYLLPPVLARMRAADIMRELRVREARTETLIDEMDRGSLDAIVIAAPVTRADLQVEPLFVDRFVLAGNASRMARLGPVHALRPVALDPDQLLLLDEGHCLADQALEVCGLTRRQTRIDLGASSLSTLVGLAAAGFGFTFLPEIAICTETAAAPAMVLMRFADPQPTRRIVLVRRATSSPAPWFTDLAAHMRDAGTALITSATSLPAAENREV